MGYTRPFAGLAKAAILLVVTAGLGACVSPTPYQPAEPRGFGYSEVRLDANKYRVTFRGNALTKRETVEDYLLYRAAELTLQNKFTHFILIGRDTEAKTSYRYYVDRFGGRGWFYHGFPDWHDPFDRPQLYDVQPVTTYTATAEIVMVSGAKDDGDARAFDAREVLVQIGPRVVRPEPVR
jgi:hypothetical protein